MKLIEIAQARLINQHIADSNLSSGQEVVSVLGAMQAQEYVHAKWAIGLRAAGLNQAAVEQAFNDGSILRTHMMRPTWHFVAPADIRWLQQLTAPRVQKVNGYPYRTNQLDAATLARSCDILARALEGGRHLMRPALRAALAQKGIDAEGQRLAYILMNAELEAVICSGPRLGKQFSYALLEERAAPARAIDREQALRELALRYFSTRGPAAIPDFVWWSGLTTGDARTAAALLPSDFERISIDGREHIFRPAPARSMAGLQTTFLMPDYDEYGISYKDRSALHAEAVEPWPARGADTRSLHALVIDGQMRGSWQRSATTPEVAVHISGTATAARRRAVDRAVARYREFFAPAPV